MAAVKTATDHDSISTQNKGEDMNGELARIWQVTRFCCTSGQCIECHARSTGRQRKRIVHADKLTKPMAELMAKNWSRYDAKASQMP